MSFPLETVAPAVEGRAEEWTALGLAWRVSGILPNHGKAIVRVDWESADWMGQLIVWVSGEAELDLIRLADDRQVATHYDLAGPDDLSALLDDVRDTARTSSTGAA